MLFQPHTIRGLEFRHRIAMSRMLLMRSGTSSGCATDFHVVQHVARALGGEGSVMMETAAVLPVAATGEEGLRIARTWLPDLVLLDVHLPDINGHDVLERLRTDESPRGLVVAVLTADATSESRRRSREVAEVLRWIDMTTTPGGTR